MCLDLFRDTAKMVCHTAFNALGGAVLCASTS
nr:MAG TPA: hypothetical protein [Caudoviricetes sp.]